MPCHHPSPGYQGSVSLVALPLHPAPSTPTRGPRPCVPLNYIKDHQGAETIPSALPSVLDPSKYIQPTISERRIAVSTPSRWRWRPAHPPSSSLQRPRRAGHPGSERQEAPGWTAGLYGSVARGTSCLMTRQSMPTHPRSISITHSSERRGKCGPTCQHWGGKSWSGSGSWAAPSGSRPGGRARV